ncbi:MAG: preprotein translocase subunit SecG [Acidobacteria bacterium]|nr:preprotein translocase subunit SecG [Acidobacteriota bacterium]
MAFLTAGGLIFAGVKFYPPLLTALHVLVCALLTLVVLLQSGRAADLAGAFGGAGSQTAFGPRGAATVLSKATTFLAVVFMVTSLALAIYASGPRATSLVEEAPKPAEQQGQPALPPAESTPAGPPAPSQP